MNYEDMSDFEINSAVHNLTKKLGFSLEFLGCDAIKWSKKGEQDIITGKVEYSKNGLIDYCNNPSDAWAIMRDCLIGVSPDEDGVTCHFYGDWTAKAFCSQACYTHKNPLRAAMIVFLMMHD
ncbi:MAG: phage protein NinX family protein [Aeromonadaceae bacterium]